MADIVYEKLSRQQKLAIFLIVIGPEAAAEVLRHFEDTEVEAVCREMAQFAMIPDEIQKQALEEFSGVVAEGAGAIMGGASFAQRTLEIAKGGYKASSIMGRVGPSAAPVDIIKDIGEMEGRQIFNLIKNEQPQTLAFVLSYLEGAKAAEVFSFLSPEMRDDVIERLGTIESTSLDLVGKVARSLGRHIDPKARPTFHRSGGVRAVAGLLNQLEKDMSKTLLARLEDRNTALGAAIRKKMFSFEDIGRLQLSDLQRVLREVETNSLAISMKSASEPLREKILSALPKRAAESLKEEIQLLGPVRLKDVEAAQDGVIQAVRHLEEEGQISLDNDSTQMVVG
jgi:flagellar motor switch protein FliG